MFGCWGDPEGKQLKQSLPKGVRNVVNSEESVESGICQNPELVSSFVNKHLGSGKLCHGLLHCRKVWFTAHTLVEFRQVHTDAYITVRFGYHHHPGTLLSRNLNFEYHSQLLHSLQLSTNFSHEGDGNLSWNWNNKWLGVWSEFNLMFSFELPKSLEQLWEQLNWACVSVKYGSNLHC